MGRAIQNGPERVFLGAARHEAAPSAAQGNTNVGTGTLVGRQRGARMRSYPVGRIEEFTEGSRKVVSCDATEIGVFKIDGEFVAWYNQCSHRQGPVCQGRIYKRVIEPVDAEQRTRMLAFDENETHIA